MRERSAPQQPKRRLTPFLFALLILLTASLSSSLADPSATLLPQTPPPEQSPTTTPSSQTPAINQSTLDQLDSDDWAARERATRLLLQDNSLTPQAVSQAYQSAKSPEQRHRLVLVAQHHFLRVNAALKAAAQPLPDSNAGVLGVAVEGVRAQEIPDVGLHAIRVVTTYPGLPGYTCLEPGDLITAINNQPFDLATQPHLLVPNFQALVQAHHAGTTLPITIYRDGNKTTLNIKLASKAALQLITEGLSVSPTGNTLQRDCESFINTMTGKPTHPAQSNSQSRRPASADATDPNNNNPNAVIIDQFEPYVFPDQE